MPARSRPPVTRELAVENSDVAVFVSRAAFIAVFSVAANRAAQGIYFNPAWAGVILASLYSIVVAAVWWRRKAALAWLRPFSLLVDIIMLSGVVATYGAVASGVKDLYYLVIFAAAMWYYWWGAVVAAATAAMAFVISYCHGTGLSVNFPNALSVAYTSGAALMPLVGYVAGLLFHAHSRDVTRLAEIEHEISLARRLQQNLLPRSTPDVPGWEIASDLRPARQVGGDMYCFPPLPDGSSLIVIADVAGKSVSGLMYLSLVHSHLRTIASTTSDLADIVGELNRRAYAELQPDSYVAAVFIKIRPGSSTVAYVNCGHLPPLVVRPGSGRAEMLGTDDPIIGASYNHVYREGRTEVPPGGLVLCYTDGIVEARNRSGEMYGEERLRRFAVQKAHLPPADLCRALLEEVAR
ncbi:MAG: serine/threonine-protein phosphatase, partial [Armatimonadetes bacterium]|nr:serine/threonine-protein phosphatase [Armatimonadota bacterium]